MSRQRTILLLLGCVFLVSASHLAAQTLQGPELLLNSKKSGPQWQVDVATAANGSFVVVWASGGVRGTPSNVIARVFSANGNPKTPEIRVSSVDPGRQSHPAVAASANGDFVVVWQSRQAPDSRIWGQRFTADGQRAGKPFRLLNPGGDDDDPQSEPDVARAAGGRFVVVWKEVYGFVPYHLLPLSFVNAQRFAADGRPLDQSFPVGMVDGGGGVQSEPAVAMNASGAFIICWTDVSPDPDTYSLDDIFATLFTPQGHPVESFYVNPDDTSWRFQNDAAVALADDGGFVVVWRDELADSFLGDFDNSDGIRGQRFAADHSRQGDTFHVNTTTPGYQIYPSVALGPDGGFVVVWQSNNDQDGDGWGVFVRRFAADGTPRSREVQINIHTPGNQSLPAVAVAPNGRGAVVWQSMGRDGNDFGVAARRVSLPQ
ncbi:MAG TPA: hypothetical protein VNJ70_19770 [Thermoanaerobaculia bacterium]|nr:hypothetical protein [Thermoanaerobaculia bacterium]